MRKFYSDLVRLLNICVWGWRKYQLVDSSKKAPTESEMWALKRVGLACELHNRPKACPPAGSNLHSVVEEAQKVLHCSEEQGGGGIKAEVTGTHHPSRCSPFIVSPALQPQWVPSIPQALQGDCLGAHLLPPPGPSRLHPPHLTQAETQRQTSTITV